MPFAHRSDVTAERSLPFVPTIWARFRFALWRLATGIPPRTMGIGPVPATRKLLALANLKLANIDVIELNEAFAAQSLAARSGRALCTMCIGVGQDVALLIERI